MMTPKEIQEKLSNIFFPHVIVRLDALRKSRQPFVHYTSAESTFRILQNQEFWMRNAMSMEDYTEIHYGIKKVVDFFGAKKDFWDSVDKITSGLSQKIKKLFDDWIPSLQADTYLISISEHHSPDEDKTGRLSMWRRVGQDPGVAFVLNPSIFLSEVDVLNAYTYPVFYDANDRPESYFQAIVENIRKETDFLSTLDEQILHSQFLFMLQSFAFSIKPRVFSEEKEWRVVFRPAYARTTHLASKVVVIKGLPERVYSVPLRTIKHAYPNPANPDEKFDYDYLEIKNLIRQIIVGPSKLPHSVRVAFIEMLKKHGVSDPEQKVVISEIPLRV